MHPRPGRGPRPLPWILTALLAAAPAAAAQLEVADIKALQALGNDGFNTSVAIDGDTLAMGTSGTVIQSVGPDESASVVVFRRDAGGTPDDPQDDTWVQEAVLPNPLEADSNFGFRLELDGDRLIVGAPGHVPGATHSGAAVIYRRTGGVWSHEATLKAADATTSSLFGSDVALHGDVAVVGAVRDGELWPLAGAAYVFQLEGGTWVQRAKLHGDLAVAQAGRSGAGARFGSAVDMDGDTIVVGADGEALKELDYQFVGAVYVFDRDEQGTADPADDTWTQQARIQPESPGAEFGCDVALDGRRFIAGARSDDVESFGTGSASIYLRDDVGTPGELTDDVWRLEAKLSPGVAQPVELGWFVDLRDGFAVARSKNPLTTDGTLHVFRRSRNQWVRVADIVAENSAGGLVACDGVTAAIGKMAGIGGKGGVHLYALEAGPWSWLGDALAVDGATPALFGVGHLRAGGTLELTIHDGFPSAPALLVIGGSADELPFKGGTLVPSPDRLLPVTLDASGDATMTAPAAAAAGLDLTLYLQAWLADRAGPQGFTATNAVAIELP